MTRRSFFQRATAFAATIALAPELAFGEPIKKDMCIGWDVGVGEQCNVVVREAICVDEGYQKAFVNAFFFNVPIPEEFKGKVVDTIRCVHFGDHNPRVFEL